MPQRKSEWRQGRNGLGFTVTWFHSSKPSDGVGEQRRYIGVMERVGDPAQSIRLDWCHKLLHHRR